MENEQIAFLEKAKMALQQNLRWGGMLVTIGYVFIGLMALMGLASAFVISQTSGIAALVVLLVYCMLLMMYFYPLRKLNGFLQGCRDALETANERYLVEGLSNLAAAMRLFVIYTLVGIGVYVLRIFVAICLGTYSNMLAA